MIPPRLLLLLPRFTRLTRLTRVLSTSAVAFSPKPMPPRPKVDESEITERFLKGSGPGGQKINKTSSAVQLRHIPTGMVVKSQETRSRSQNRSIARGILAERLEQLLNGNTSRLEVLQERDRKRKASKTKKARRKYRAIELPGDVGMVDSNGVLVDAIVEDSPVGDVQQPPKRLPISVKPIEAREWDHEKPGIVEVILEEPMGPGGMEVRGLSEGVRSGSDEEDIVLAYKGN